MLINEGKFPPPPTDHFPGYNEVLRYFVPAVWGREMVRQAGDNMPSTPQGGGT